MVERVERFVNTLRADAETAARESGVPAWLIITQAAHESMKATVSGFSGLALRAKNLFGFTGELWKRQGKPVVEMPTNEYVKDPGTGKLVKKVMYRPFRAYPSYLASMRDYAGLLSKAPRYAAVMAYAKQGDKLGTFEALGRSGYATDPNYAAGMLSAYKTVAGHLA